MGRIQVCVVIFSGVVCTLLAGTSVFYMALFYTGAYTGASINEDVSHHHPALISHHPLLNNLVLLLIFFISHSILARDWIKKVMSPLLSPPLYRHFYFLVSSVTLFLIVYGWTPLPQSLWHIDTLLILLPIYGIQMFGVLLIIVSFFSINPLEFCGLQEPLHQLMGTSKRCHHQAKDGGESDLIVTGVYGVVRHPMYTGILLLLWSESSMTQGKFLLALVSTLYLFLVVPLLEEPDLIKHYGLRYHQYISNTGMFFPYLSTSTTHSTNHKKS